MGGCVGTRDLRADNMRLADQIFGQIDSANKGKLDRTCLTSYFRQYSESQTSVLMNEMDFNQDGVITRGEWLGYWQYVRLAGYNQDIIRKSLKKLSEGLVSINFPNAANYKNGVPRQTLIGDIVKKMKNDNELPVHLQE